MTPTTSRSASGHDGILAKLKAASSAEDFFALLDVSYDAKVVNVARLHILRRMGEALAKENFEGRPESAVASHCKALLERAYQDFVTATPLDHRVFKVLKEAVAKPAPGNFVPLGKLFE